MNVLFVLILLFLLLTFAVFSDRRAVSSHWSVYECGCLSSASGPD